MSRIPTVVHVEAGMHLYGGALQVFYLLRGLQSCAVRNVLVAPVGSAIAQAARGVVDKVYEIPLSGDLDVAFIFRLKRILQAEQADIVHLHSRRGADVLGGVAARLARIPSVVSRRVDNPETPWLARLKYRLFDHVIAISEGIRRVLINEGVPYDHVTCVHSAVDIEKYSQSGDCDWFCQEFRLPAPAKVFAVIAQLIPRKGHRYVLDVLPGLLQRYPDLYVLFLGQGPLQDEIAQRLTADAFQGRVQLAGFRNDLERILPCLFGVVHPADMEGLGVSLLQAAASGLPIVGSRAGGIPEIVSDGINGYLISPGDTQQLAVAMSKLLDNEQLACDFGQAGRKLVEERFSISAMVRGNLAVYDKVFFARRH